jgi:hypothetical protein
LTGVPDRKLRQVGFSVEAGRRKIECDAGIVVRRCDMYLDQQDLSTLPRTLLVRCASPVWHVTTDYSGGA